MRNCLDSINPFQSSVAFHMETSYLQSNDWFPHEMQHRAETG